MVGDSNYALLIFFYINLNIKLICYLSSFSFFKSPLVTIKCVDALTYNNFSLIEDFDLSFMSVIMSNI